jgi:hypothetical protein
LETSAMPGREDALRALCGEFRGTRRAPRSGRHHALSGRRVGLVRLVVGKALERFARGVRGSANTDALQAGAVNAFFHPAVTRT